MLYESFENGYCTKVLFDDEETALSCVAPFEKEYKLGVNLPAKRLSDAAKAQYKRKAVVKYCDYNGIDSRAVSIDSMWQTILKEFCYALNDYDHLKYEHDSLKKAREAMKNLEAGILNGFAHVETVTDESELPFKPESVFKPSPEYENVRLNI